MRTLAFALRGLARDLRSGDLLILLLALVVAVSSLTAVGFFTDRVRLAVERQAGEVLAADLRLESARPIDPGRTEEARRRGLEVAQTWSMPSVVYFGEESSLVALRAVDEGYPLRGTLKVAERPFGPAQPIDAVPGRNEAWADSRLLAKLGADVGSTLAVGALSVRVTRVLDYRPDQGSGFADLSATLLINLADLPSTQLVQPGSRVRRAVLFAGEPGTISEFRAWLDGKRVRGERLTAIADASPQIRASADRAGRFLSLASLVSVLLAAIAVAMAARRYATRRLDDVALMKCMGATQGFVLSTTLLQLLALALLAAAIGAALGWLAQAGLAWLVRDLVKGDLPQPGLGAAWLGLLTAVLVLIGFALPPLLQLKRVPPARVLRKNVEPPPLRDWAVALVALGSLLALLFWLVRDPRLVAVVAGGVAATFAILALAGWLLVRALGSLRGRVGVAWRYGLANVARRGRESVAQIVAFGLGLMVLLLLALVRDDLLDEWQASLPADAPNYFMINIRPDEAAALTSFFDERGLPPTELVPLVRARLASINGTPVEQLAFTGERAEGFVEREANLTWSRRLQEDNQLLEGQWWQDGDGGGARVSVEREFAEAVGLKLDDELEYDVAGEIVGARVTSIREVQWDSFRPNFFVVFSPGVLERVAGTLITSVHVSPEQRPALVDLVRRFPEVTIIDLDALLAQVREVMGKASLAVQYVFLFTLAAGLMVLLAAVQATRDERRFESAMLRTLGASRATVFAGLAAEFGVLGVLAGLLASIGATIAGFFLAREVFELAYTPDPLIWLVGIVGGGLLVGGAGLLAARSVVTHPPAATLRRQA